MGQLGFFDADNRLTALSAKGDPLEAIDRLVPWESFRGDIEAAVLTPETERKSTAGRKPIDAIVLFRMLILQSLYNLSDEQVEYQVRDRLSFTRFLTSGIEDCIPDGTTLWLFREKLAKAGVIEKLFDRFDRHLGAKGYIARGGQIVDATIVPVPKQRNTREENEAIKSGRTPAATLDCLVLLARVPLSGHRHDGGIDDLSTTSHIAIRAEMPIEAIEQLFNHASLGQLLAEQPQRRAVGNAVPDPAPEKPRK